MVFSKTRMILLGLSVLCLGIVLGTSLWLKLGPRPTLTSLQHKSLQGLNVYGTVPDFALVERNTEEVRLGDLRGTVWIADFIYTTCQDTCPLQSAELAKLQQKWRDKPELRFVSFSVDPERDSPPVLADYAAQFNADERRWLFLTGEKEQLMRLIREGFRLSAAPAPDFPTSNVILHSPRFVLVDRQARIRGYYDSRDKQALERLESDAITLLKE
jgi:cytochrome oxidase Cu insertion factor (SCO1/SenC/PrrC family)